MGFVWAVRDRELGVVREAHQGGEEGVGCVGRVILLDCEGQGERHEKVQEGAFCSSLGDPAAWLQEGAEACSGADRVFAGADLHSSTHVQHGADMYNESETEDGITDEVCSDMEIEYLSLPKLKREIR